MESTKKDQEAGVIWEKFPPDVRSLIESRGWTDFGPNITVSQEMVERFADLSGDWNPIHTDPEEAKRRGYGSTIVPGMLIVILIPRMVPLFRPLVVNSGLKVIDCRPRSEFFREVPVGASLSARTKVSSRFGGDHISLAGSHEVYEAEHPDPVAAITRMLICSLPRLA